MSWSVSVSRQPTVAFLDAVRDAKIDDASNKPEIVAQWNDQLSNAKAAVAALMMAGTFGAAEGDEFSAYLSGHANHDGVDDGGYTTTEFVSVSVTRHPAVTQ